MGRIGRQERPPGPKGPLCRSETPLSSMPSTASAGGPWTAFASSGMWRSRRPPGGPLPAGVRYHHAHRPTPAAPHPGHRRVGVEQHPRAQHPGLAAGPGRGEADRETPGAHCRGTAGGGAQAPRGAVGQSYRPGAPRPPQCGPAGGQGAGGRVSCRDDRWLITAQDLLVMQAAGHKLRETSAFVPHLEEMP